MALTLTPAILAELAAAHGLRRPSIVIRSLDADGWEASLDPGAPLSPASMIKVPLSAAVLSLAEQGAVELDRPVRVDRANLTANDAGSPLVEGYEATAAELIELAIARSDNVATNMLIDVARRERANTELSRLGLRATFIRRKLSGADPLIDDPEATGRNAHPAEDAAHLFGLIARGAISGAERLRAALAAQIWNDKLPRRWDRTDRFEHKTGDTSEVSHDGGILTTSAGRRYVIVVYTSLPSGPQSDERIAAFGAALRALL